MSGVYRERDRGYRDLIAWQKGVELVGSVYRATGSWPRDEQFGLINQTRRSVVSVPANIAEGKGRTGSREFLHHLSIAHGSLCEVETHLHIAEYLAYMDQHALGPLLEQSSEVGRLIRGIMKSLRQKPS